MEFRRPLILCCLLVPALAAGCRQNHAARELLERELRLQEDRIYQLEAELEDAHRALDAVKGTSPGLRDAAPVTPNEPRTFAPPASSLTPPSSSLTPPSTTLPPPATNLGPPSVELPAPGAASPGSAPKFQGPPAIVPPSVDLPEGIPGRAAPPPASSPSPTKPDGAAGDATPFKPMSSPKFLPPSVKANPVFDSAAPAASAVLRPSVVPPASAAAVPPSAVSPSAVGARIKSAALGRATRGVNLDGYPGDDGVLVVVEARNTAGEVIAPAAAVSLVLIDPAVPGEGGRYARWDFTADDAAALFRPANGDASAGSYFELPWPDAPPAHARLKLFVRLTTSDGKRIELDRDVTVDLSGTSSQAGVPPAFMPPQYAGSAAESAAPSAFVPTAAEAEPLEAGLHWGRRDDAATPVVMEAATVAEPPTFVPREMTLPVSNSLPPPMGTDAPAASPQPVESPAGPLLFPADAALGAPEMLPRR